MENGLKLAPPWIQYVNGLKAMFGEDPEIRIEYDNDSCTVKMYVENEIKADSLGQLIPAEKEFGNVKLTIKVIPANKAQSKAMLFKNALNGNPAFEYVHEITGVSSNTFTYVVFAKEVVQYYNDNLADPHGLRSTLYQDIASEIFDNKDGVFFCTESVVGDELPY